MIACEGATKKETSDENHKGEAANYDAVKPAFEIDHAAKATDCYAEKVKYNSKGVFTATVGGHGTGLKEGPDKPPESVKESYVEAGVSCVVADVGHVDYDC